MTDHHQEAHQGVETWEPIGSLAARIAGRFNASRLVTDGEDVVSDLKEKAAGPEVGSRR